MFLSLSLFTLKGSESSDLTFALYRCSEHLFFSTFISSDLYKDSLIRACNFVINSSSSYDSDKYIFEL